MTVIVGLVDNGNVYLGADRSASEGWLRGVRAESKLFRLGEFLIGTCGSHRMAQAVQYSLIPLLKHPENQPDLRFLSYSFSSHIKNVCADVGIVSKSDTGEDRLSEGGLLFGYRGHLYRMSNNFQIDEFQRPYDAIGSGAPFALGALAYICNTSDGVINPSLAMKQALTVSEDLCIDVSGPFDIEVLKGEHHA